MSQWIRFTKLDGCDVVLNLDLAVRILPGDEGMTLIGFAGAEAIVNEVVERPFEEVLKLASILPLTEDPPGEPYSAP